MSKLRSRLEEALRKRFPGEEIELLGKLLSLAAEKGGLIYRDIEIQEEVKQDLLLCEKERLLLPTKTSRSLAWEDRILTLKSDEEYEMPHIVRYIIRDTEETGNWNPSYAVRRYLEDIGEEESEEISKIFEKVKEKTKDNKMPPRLLKESMIDLGLVLDEGKIIAELKGGGAISPCLRESIRTGSIRYEINPSLCMKTVGKHYNEGD